MESLQAQYKQLKQAWDTAFPIAQSNPASYQAHLPLANLEQLNEVVDTIGYWIDRPKAPRGFAPTFSVGRALVSTALVAATASAQALARGEYGHFPGFLTSLNQTVSGLHAMVIFGDGNGNGADQELTGRLSESMALVSTAQRELSEKADLLKKAAERISELESAIEEAQEHASAIATQATETQEHEVTASEAAAGAKKSAAEVGELRDQVKELVAEAETLRESLVEAGAELERVQAESKQQQKLITALLPKGASAGLASAFAGRVSQLERTKWFWAFCFGVSVVGLGAMAWKVIGIPVASSEAMWQHVLQRLPFAAPFIWGGWFSAVQYGNTLRVQEDYAFKEATSKAFAGYRDHMEHLANVALKDGNTAMLLMAESTIEILAREPLRIFQGIAKDASPGHGLLAAFSRREGKGAKAE